MPAMWNSWAPRWRPWPSEAGPGMRKRTRRCRACLPPNPQLFLISSTNTWLLLLQLQLAVKQQSARLEEKQLIRLYHLRLFWKHAWISEPVRQWNRRTRPEFDVPVISKLIGLNPKCKNVTQWYWGPIQMCSLWSVICICRTGLTDDLLELSKHLELVKRGSVLRDHLRTLISLSYNKADFHAIYPQKHI